MVKQPPARKSRGRPRRETVGLYLAEYAAALRRQGLTLRQIQERLNAEREKLGLPPLNDVGTEEKPYPRGARRWADAGEQAWAKMRRLLDEIRQHHDLKNLLWRVAQGERAVVAIQDPDLVEFARTKPLPFEVVLQHGRP